MPRRYILIADDDRLLCDLVTTALRAEGHEASFALDGAPALAAMQRRRPDLLILDASMPGMDGFNVLQALRTDPKAPPTLMLTARRSEKDVRQARELGAASYIVKPFVIPVLIARVHALLTPGPLPVRSTPQGQAPMTATPAVVARLDDTEWID